MTAARRARRFVGAILLSLLCGTSAAPLDLWHGPEADGCCGVAVPHDPEAHRIGGAVATPLEHDHCFLCHWLRSLQVVLTAGDRLDPAALHAGEVARLAAPPQALSETGSTPGRSPPARL
jgi:hypothetical protein